MPIIDCDFKDPINTSIITGSIEFIADDTEPPLLKGTSVSVTSGDNVTLLAGIYKVYYTNENGLRQYTGSIVVAAIDATLVSLLAV